MRHEIAEGRHGDGDEQRCREGQPSASVVGADDGGLLQALEVRMHIRRTLIAPGPIRLESFADDRHESRRSHIAE